MEMSFDVDIDVECGECGKPLSADVVDGHRRKVLSVEPCGECLASAKQEGVAETMTGGAG